MKRIIMGLFVSLFVLAGCAANLSSADGSVFSLTYKNGAEAQVATTGRELHEIARQVASEYVLLSDRAATSQDAASLALIGVATYAGYGVIDGFSASQLSRVALTGFALNTTANYFDPATTRTALLDGARRASCLSTVAMSISASGASDARFVAVHQALLRNAVLVRAAIHRDIPNYLALLREAQNVDISSSSGLVSTEAAVAMPTADEVEAAIELCFELG